MHVHCCTNSCTSVTQSTAAVCHPGSPATCAHYLPPKSDADLAQPCHHRHRPPVPRVRGARCTVRDSSSRRSSSSRGRRPRPSCCCFCRGCFCCCCPRVNGQTWWCCAAAVLLASGPRLQGTTPSAVQSMCARRSTAPCSGRHRRSCSVASAGCRCMNDRSWCCSCCRSARHLPPAQPGGSAALLPAMQLPRHRQALQAPTAAAAKLKCLHCCSV
jgi:hypothetical protein